MRRLRTLRVRFGLWTAGVFLVGLSVFGVYVYASMARGLQAAQDESLEIVASQVAAGVDLVRGRPVFSEDFAAEPENQSLLARGFTVRVLDPAGKTLQGFGTDLARLPGLDGGRSQSTSTIEDSSGGGSYRVRSEPVESGGQAVAVVQVGQTRQDVEATLLRLRSALLISVPLLVVLTGLSGTFLAGRALAAIDRITRTARAIADGSRDLSTRLDLPQSDDEVGRLVETFNAMLTRLEDSFRRERQFTADASHELRTPLAAMQAILGTIRQRRRAPEEYERAFADLADEANRLRSLTDHLLALARSETGSSGPAERVDLSILLRDVAESMGQLAADKGLELAYEVPPGLTVQGSQDDLARLLVNLVDNAIKFTQRGAVRLAAGERGDGWACVTVRDSGPGIPAGHMPLVFDRFFRGDQARSSAGVGLGLALAAAVARAHGGRIEVTSRLGEGSQFTVLLPPVPGR